MGATKEYLINNLSREDLSDLKFYHYICDNEQHYEDSEKNI
jgi:hypothetical protein